MKIVIDIPEEIYQEAKTTGYSHLYDEEVANAVTNGTPIQNGIWVPHYSGYRQYYGYDCSICKHWCEFERKFCGHCGAEMKREEEE